MKKTSESIVKVRFSDCDPLSHLNNVKYVEYMLNTREDHLEQFFNFSIEDYLKKTGMYLGRD